MLSLSTRGLIRLYALCAVPTECKLVLVSGHRFRHDLAAKVVPFILQMFAPPSQESRREQRDVYTYIFAIQRAYYNQLHELGLCDAWGVAIDKNGDLIADVDNIRTLARTLHEIDGTEDDADLDLLCLKEEPNLSFEADTDTLREALEEARDAWAQFEDFRCWCNLVGLNYAVRADVLTSELTNYFAHFCRAYKGVLRGDPRTRANEEIAAGIKHLIRMVLDFRKGVILTAVKQIQSSGRLDSKAVSRDLVNAVLVARQRETNLSSTDHKKVQLFKAEAGELIDILKHNISSQ